MPSIKPRSDTSDDAGHRRHVIARDQRHHQLRRGLLSADGGDRGINGLGPASRGDHAPGETVDIASISRQAGRAAILMSRLAEER